MEMEVLSFMSTALTNHPLKPDAALKNFFHYRSHFADIINLVCFDGYPFLSPDSFLSEDTDMSAVIDHGIHPISFNAYRDTLVKADAHGIYILMAIENQVSVDYHMPLRVLDYDSSTYRKQYQNHLDERKRNKNAQLNLMPVFTVVLYYGERRWSGPRTLLDMMEVPDEMKGKINNWNAHIIDVKELNASLLGDKDTRDLIEGLQLFYKWKGDIEVLRERRMSRETAIVLASLVDKEGELLKVVKKEEKEEVNMCQSIDNFRKKAIQEGMSMMILELLKQKIGNLSSETVERIEKSSSEELKELSVEIFKINNEEDVLTLLRS